jgi:predicted nucleotidyltransferase component of viral defense system
MRTTSAKAQSVLTKLVAMHRETGKPHQYLIDRFAQERFLYRLSIGHHRDDFVLKGGALLTALTDRFYRATRDIDVLTSVSNDIGTIRAIIVEAIGVNDIDDGMEFDTKVMAIERIRTQGEERGIRLRIPAYLGKARATVQVDLGFDDVVLLPNDSFCYPVMLPEYPSPIIRAYSAESVIAEKLEAIASLDMQTTRYKDFDDIVELANRMRFDVASLWLAIKMTFEHRGTSLDRITRALGEDRATATREVEYRKYRTRDNVERPLTTLSNQLSVIRQFVAPILSYDHDGISRAWEDHDWRRT